MTHRSNQVISVVNKRLRKLGHLEKLVRGDGYQYFSGGQASQWMTSSVYVYSADQLTVDQWIAEFNNMRSQHETEI